MRISDWSSDVCSSDLRGPDSRSATRLRARVLDQEDRSEGDDHGHVSTHFGGVGSRDGGAGFGAGDGVRPRCRGGSDASVPGRSEEHTSELQSLMCSTYAVFCLKKKSTYIEANTKHNVKDIV